AALPALLSESKRQKLKEAAALYLPEQLLTIIDWLIDAEKEIRSAPSPRISIEALLLRLFRVRKLVPLDLAIKRLEEMERRLGAAPAVPPTAPPPQPVQEPPKPQVASIVVPTAKSTPRYDTLMQFAAVELEGKLEK